MLTLAAALAALALLCTGPIEERVASCFDVLDGRDALDQVRHAAVHSRCGTPRGARLLTCRHRPAAAPQDGVFRVLYPAVRTLFVLEVPCQLLLWEFLWFSELPLLRRSRCPYRHQHHYGEWWLTSSPRLTGPSLLPFHPLNSTNGEPQGPAASPSYQTV